MERSLARGVRAAGGEAVSAGVIPTSAVSYLTKTHGFSAGAVISASHNPFDDNGIKIFSPLGVKIPDAWELEIEADVLEGRGRAARPRGGRRGQRRPGRRLRRVSHGPYPADRRAGRSRRPQGRHRLRQRRELRPGAAHPPRARLRRSKPSTPRRTARTSTPAAARSIPKAWRRGSARTGRRSASPTTGTPTGPCGWTGTAASSAATTRSSSRPFT